MAVNTNFVFEQYAGNIYDAYFQATGEDVWLYLNREKKGTVIVSSSAFSVSENGEAAGFSNDYVEKNAPEAVAIKMKYPEGVYVRVRSYGDVNQAVVLSASGGEVALYPQNNGDGSNNGGGDK